MLKSLNKGAFSDVLLCQHVYSKQKVVLKKVDRTKAWKTFMGQESIFQEVSLLERTCMGQVPHMMQLIEVFSSEKFIYIVADFYPIGDLYSYNLKVHKQDRLVEGIIKRIMYQVCLAVNGLHERNILHRDLKPTNILIKRTGKKFDVKLADLGVSVYLGDANKTQNMFIGTQGFIAPEMLEHRPYSLPLDIYSLGATMYQLLFKETPFKSESRAEHERRVRREPLSFE